MISAIRSVHAYLYRPSRVLILCLGFAFASLVFGGNFIRLFQLHRDQGLLQGQMEVLEIQIRDLERQLKIAKDPTYIERQALDRYDLAEEHDLVFVFADQ